MKTANSHPPNLVRRIDPAGVHGDDLRHLLKKQWLVTNGLGGFASGTIAGAVTCRYHGLLIAALAAPLGRTLMLNHLDECVRLPDGSLVQIGGFDPNSSEEFKGTHYLKEFRLENQLPTWHYEIGGIVIEKRILMPYLQNTTHLTYTLLSKEKNVQIELRPSVHFRPLEGNVGTALSPAYEVRARGERFEIHSGEDYPCLRLLVDGQPARFIHDGKPAHLLAPAGEAVTAPSDVGDNKKIR